METRVDLLIEGIEGRLHFLLNFGLILVGQPLLAIDIDRLPKGDVPVFTGKELAKLQRALVDDRDEGDVG